MLISSGLSAAGASIPADSGDARYQQTWGESYRIRSDGHFTPFSGGMGLIPQSALLLLKPMPNTADTPAQTGENVEFRAPALEDGAALWRLAKGTGVLDVNTPYAYLLWARDFAETSVIATVDGEPAGFISGYLKPADPSTLFIWQVAVDASFRGRRLASRMLADVVARSGASRLETTITSDNAASIALFTGLARNHGTELRKSTLFTEEMFPPASESGEEHAAEDLYTVEPLQPSDPEGK